MKNFGTIILLFTTMVCFGQYGLKVTPEVKPRHEKCRVSVSIKDHNKDIEIAKKFKNQELLLASGGRNVPYEYYAQGHIVVEPNHPKQLLNIYFNPLNNREVRKRIYKVDYMHEHMRVYDAVCVMNIEGIKTSSVKD